MATITWRGDAPAKSQVWDFQFSGTWEANDVVTFVMNGKSVSVVAGSTVIATVVTTMVAAWNALNRDSFPEFGEVLASVLPAATNKLRLTATTPGKPFSVSVSTTEDGGGAADSQVIGSAIVVQASTGPAHVDEPANYSGGALPANGDTLVCTESSNSMRYGLNALAAVTLDSLIINQSFTGDIGLPNYDNDGGYYQYRLTYLQVGATTVQIGSGNGSGSGRIKLDLGSVQTTVNVNNSGRSRDQAFNAIVLKGTHADNALNVLKGSVDVAPEQGVASTVATVRVSYVTNMTSDSTVRLGSNVTLSEVSVLGGSVEINSDTASIIQYNGTVAANEGDHAAVECYGGEFDWQTTGTISALTASNCKIDLSHDLRPKDFDAAGVIELYRGAVLNDPAGVLPSGVKIRDNTGGVTINQPAGKTYQVT